MTDEWTRAEKRKAQSEQAKAIMDFVSMLSDKIKELEKENAELKAIERMALYSKLSDQLTKAKEIIKNLLILKNDHYGNTKMEWRVEVTEQAEQFLKEIEK